MKSKVHTIGLFVAALIVAAGSWSILSATDRPDFVDLYPQIDKSPAGLDAYKQSAITLHDAARKSKVDQFHSTITLAEPQPIEDVLRLMESHQITPRLVYAFAEGKDGKTVTLATRMGGRVDVEEMLPMMATDSDARLLGVASIIGSVPTQRLGLLQEDPRVFLVDISADEHFVKNPGNKEYAHHLAWDLLHQN